MSVQTKSRRKKNFKKPEDKASIEEASSDDVLNQVEESKNLNVRRSSRQPKPKKHDDYEVDERNVHEITGKVCGENSFSTSGMCNSAELSEVYVSPEVRRETRKSFQSYLETLGYNTDFSKISSPETNVKSRGISNKKTVTKQSKSVEKVNVTPSDVVSMSGKSGDCEVKNAPTRVRASSRVPKPKKTFALLEERDSQGYSKEASDKSGKFLENTGNSPNLNLRKEISSKTKTSSEGHIREQKYLKGQRHAASSKEQHCPTTAITTTTTPLSKHDVDEAEMLSDGTDAGKTRTSTRVRVPKRKFSLIEENQENEAKKQRVMSPEQIADVEPYRNRDAGGDVMQDNSTSVQSRSSLVIKRIDSKKLRTNRKRGELRTGKVVDEQEKDTLVSTKGENHPSKISHSEPETKPGNENCKQNNRKEHITRKLRFPKDSVVVKEKTKSKKATEDENSSSKRALKRKREKSNSEKSEPEKEQKNDSKGEHIVLKLTIPHGSSKTNEKEILPEEKYHHKHHHHKHKKDKKESKGSASKKKFEGENDDASSERMSLETSSQESEKKETEIKLKKKKKKKVAKEGSSEISSDSSAVPHVKLVIKKSPVKGKDVDVIVKDESSKIAEQQSQRPSQIQESGTQQSEEGSEASVKMKNLIKKDKSLSKSPKKTIKKDMKPKVVSAYSLFTKSMRKKVLDKEPDLDFASTSRRLAEMWRELSEEGQEYWRVKAKAMRKPEERTSSGKGLSKKGNSLTKRSRHEPVSQSKDTDLFNTPGTDAIDMAAFLKLLGESLCSIGMCLKRQDQMEVHGSLSVLLDTALCSIVPLFCLTSQLPEMAGCSSKTQAEILDNLAYIIPGL